MRLLEVSVGPLDRHAVRMRGVVEREASRERCDVYVDYAVSDPAFVGGAPDAFAAALLLPAMRAAESLHVIPAVSPRLRYSLPRIRDVFHTWWPHFARVDIHLSPAAVPSDPLPERAATFFSGGVDSFYSLLKHTNGAGTLPSPMTHLIFMRGVETRLELTRDIAGTEAWVRDIAGAVGVEPIIGESNFRTSLQGPEENLHWERHYHGSALAAIALGLSPGLAYVCIPSAFTYNHLIAHGSTPLVDEMYSTERLQIAHDGAEVSRAAKIARILEWDRELVLKHLRVCWENRGGPTNCGRCTKCARTGVVLRVLGVWDQATTFPDKRMAHWENLIAQDRLALTAESLQLAREHGDREMVAMLTSAIRQKRLRDRLKALFDTRMLRPLKPAAVRLRDYLDRQPR